LPDEGHRPEVTVGFHEIAPACWRPRIPFGKTLAGPSLTAPPRQYRNNLATGGSGGVKFQAIRLFPFDSC
jgi:hypothetical protein